MAGQDSPDTPTAVWIRPSGERPTQQRDSLGHANQPVTGSADGRLQRCQADALSWLRIASIPAVPFADELDPNGVSVLPYQQGRASQAADLIVELQRLVPGCHHD